VRHVDKVLQLLKEQQLYAKPSKCFFGVKEVEYLGHIVSHEGAKVDPNNIKAMIVNVLNLHIIDLARKYYTFAERN
jgi:hypothetical protein